MSELEAWSHETVSHKNLVDLKEKCSRMPCAIDTESDGPLLVKPQLTKAGNFSYKKFIDVRRSTTVGWSIAFPDNTSYYVPLSHQKGNVPYAWGLDQLEWIVNHSPNRVYIHNLSHELNAFRQLPIQQPTWKSPLFCTMVAAWLTDTTDGVIKNRETGAEGYGLKGITRRHFGHEMSKFEDVVQGGYFGLMDPHRGEAPKYACEDAVAALLLARKCNRIIKDWGIWDWYENVETPFVYVLNHMTETGLDLDLEAVEANYRESAESCRRIKDEFLELTGAELTSNVQLQALFESGDWKPVGKPGKSGRYSTAQNLHEKMRLVATERGRRALDLMSEYQSWGKMFSTYSRSWARLAGQYADNKLHPDYNHTGTKTGRISSSYPNATNIPSRHAWAKRVMDCVTAPEGHLLGSCDYSQIDLRVMAHFAGGKLGRDFLAGNDPHQELANDIGIERTPAKTIQFASMYGAQGAKLGEQLGVDKKQANAMLKAFYKARPKITAFKQKVIEAAYDRGYVKTLSGRRVLYLDMLERNQAVIKKGFTPFLSKAEKSVLFDAWSDERKAFNAVCQGGAGDIIKKAMVDIFKEMPSSMRFQTMIHDDIRWVHETFSPAEAEELGQWVSKKMSGAWELKVPLEAGPVIGKSWKDLK